MKPLLVIRDLLHKKSDVFRALLRGLLITIALVTLIAEVNVLTYWAKGTWYTQIGAILDILAFYGIGLGFVAKSDLLSRFGKLVEDLTSPDILGFLYGNCVLMSMLCGVAFVGVSRRRFKAGALESLGSVLVLLVTPVLLAYSIFHVIVVVPIAYVGYLLASALVECVEQAVDDFESTITSGESTHKVTAKEIIASNPVAAKSFLVGLGAAVMGLVIRVLGLFLGD